MTNQKNLPTLTFPSHYYCDTCGKELGSWDLCLYSQARGGDITTLMFAHQGQCDDKDLRMSRHLKDGVRDLLTRWFSSPHNINKDTI